MGQDHICLSATSADNPLMTCLVGIPYGPKELPTKLLEITEQTNREGASKGQSGRERSYQFVYQTKDVYTAKIWCGRITHVEMASTTDRKPLALLKGMELEEDSEEDRNLDEEEPQMEWSTQLEWFTEAYPDSEYRPPPFQFSSS
ncbi:hypothetical protein DUI87_03421 [Hirundo rustica rustica]|uniref:Uncharacterized protein n=1 Tax=Hirundo rustica rustica TaxID=333673 RepID=A0A3M0L372_HIRRU|nr:hypothetical protein DUI87_03421 [Hirundo rustica rustica]